jgi:hypothetical protein
MIKVCYEGQIEMSSEEALDERFKKYWKVDDLLISKWCENELYKKYKQNFVLIGLVDAPDDEDEDVISGWFNFHLEFKDEKEKQEFEKVRDENNIEIYETQ